MWTFDRYGRWMEQRKDWVRPSAPPSDPPAEVCSRWTISPSSPTSRARSNAAYREQEALNRRAAKKRTRRRIGLSRPAIEGFLNQPTENQTVAAAVALAL